MKKKISLLLCLLIMMFVVTGCGSKEDTLEYDETSVEQVTEFLIQYCNGTDETVVEEWKSLTEYMQNYQLLQAGLPVTPESFTGAMESWQAGIEECGAYVSHGDYSYEAKKDSLEVTLPVQYEERDAEILFIFDENMYLDSMTVNAKYSKGEIAEKAGLNTLLGMGTVFAVLILIAFIISLFGFIPKLEKAMMGGKKKAGSSAEGPARKETALAVESVEAQMDDMELIAVISAAIAAAEGTSTDGFVVRSIRRRPSNKW